jgi:tetratricopeptide (TPR) repeat protein
VVLLGRTYDPFHVTISEKEPATCLVKGKSKIGEAETQTRLPFAESELKEKLDRFAFMAEGRGTPEEAELKEFGQELHKMLFHDAVWDLLKKATTASEHADGLLIELDIQSPRLSQIPWELLHDETDFLSLSRRTPIVRWIPSSPNSGTTQTPQPIEFPVRILFAGAKPWRQAPLDLGRQIRRVCRALQTAMREGTASFHPALGDEVQPDNFLTSLRTGGYHILHISTHGAFSDELQKGFLLLEDGLGNAFPLAIQTLAGMLRDTKTQIVYLDACETAQTSDEKVGETLSQTLIRSGTNAAVAMQFTIRDDHATRFSEAFYDYLMKGEPIWYAVTEARIALRDPLGRETLDWAIPVLYIRDSYTSSVTGAKQARLRFGKTEPPSPFVGREPQLDEFADKLLHPSTRVVIVHGFGGIGKSTLVQKTLSEIELLFEDSCLIDCRGLEEITQILPKINPMLSMNGVPILDEKLASLNELGRLQYLCEQLNKGRFLVVLDNIDNMQENPSTSQFLDLVEKFSETRVVVASRISIKPATYQQQLRVTALDPEHAIALMREVGRNIPQILNAEEFDLKRINEKLRGHPQSIVLAIPYFEGESFETVLTDLPARVASEEEQAKEVLKWSYSKLSSDERRFIENASVFYGDVRMQAMLDINDGKDRDTIAKLVRKNMIEFSPATDLYSLHPMLREYAYARLGDRRDEVQIKAATEIAPRMTGAFWSEALGLYEAGVASARTTAQQDLLAHVLFGLGNMHIRVGNYDKAKTCEQESLEIHQKLGDQSGIAATLHSLAIIEQDMGNYDGAKKLYVQSLEIKRKLGNELGLAVTLHQLGMIEHFRGNYDDAKRLYNQSLEIERKLGDRLAEASTIGQLAMIEQDRGNYDDAENMYKQVLEIERKLGDQSGMATTLHQLAIIEEDRGNYDDAENMYKQVLEIESKLGNQSGIAATLHQLATIEYLRDNHDGAEKLYNQSLEIDRKLGDQSGIALTLGQLGRLAEKNGDLELAERSYQDAYNIFERLGEKVHLKLANKDLERIQRKRSGN